MQDFEVMKNFICTKYEDIVIKYKNLPHKSSSMVINQAEIWCREINEIIHKLQTKTEEMKKEHLTFLHNQEDEIKNNM